MISATHRPDGSPLGFRATVSGSVVYLDNWAIYHLAEQNPPLRKRFIDAFLSRGFDLLFSVTNAAELSGPQKQSAEAVKIFLDEIGPHWFPAELNAFDVVQRERSGHPYACTSENLVKSFATDRMRDRIIVDMSDDFFRLGAMLDWVGPQRDSIRKGAADMDEALRRKISEYVGQSRRDPLWLDQHFPALPFNPSMPAMFVYINLIRVLIVDGGSLGKNDGMDFSHAVIASTFSSFATLDWTWKQRVEKFLPPNKLARIYYQQELDEMVTLMEALPVR
jgi:hypothetical protein